MSFNLKNAQLAPSLKQAAGATQVPVRHTKKEEVIQLHHEQRLDLTVLTEKVKQTGSMFTEETQYLVLGEAAQQALLHDLKMKTFIPAVTQFGEKIIAIFNAPSPTGFNCGYYETAQQAIPQLQKGYGYLVNDRNSQSYRFVPVNTTPYAGDFPDLEKALEEHFSDSTIINGDEEVLVRLGKTFTGGCTGSSQPTPPTPPTLDDGDLELEVELSDPVIDPLDELLG
ncbi:hypothetical protein [uncultured Ferrimonas sp.]|uniref:hypothetical protein n=1 Tax=uncultured Ferrimonas sp. TaxID=432640 RepID=UPI00261D69BE|nr:hypothetical protein [uncultured Ferrimonas sp.]